jgi:hypothetical protein
MPYCIMCAVQANGIPTPHHIIVSRDGTEGGPVMPQIGVDEISGAPILADPPGFVEDVDHEFVEMNGACASGWTVVT